MRLHDLPCSQHIATANSEEELTQALGSLSRFMPFVSYDIIEGAPCSGRILFIKTNGLGVKLPKECQPYQMAEELKELTESSRYAPPGDLSMQKGWEVRRSVIDNMPAAIVWAAWMPAEAPRKENGSALLL